MIVIPDVNDILIIMINGIFNGLSTAIGAYFAAMYILKHLPKKDEGKAVVEIQTK